jgi:hypothetical protein
MYSGDALLLFDGLDESGARRHDLTTTLDGWLRGLHPATEIVLSTRDAAYASASTLKLHGVRISEPADLAAALRRIAIAFAYHRGIGTDRGSWIGDRLAWAKETAGTAGLTSSPLFQVLLVVLACQHDVGGLPTARAEVVSHIVEDAAVRLEITQRRSGEVSIEGLQPESGSLVALDAFALIGAALLNEPLRAPGVERRLVELLVSDWSLSGGRARSAAHQLRLFWDEAGVFVAQGKDESVTAPNRLMTEIASARWISRGSREEVQSWVETQLALGGTSEEALLLAAGLSETVGDALVEAAVALPGHEPCLLAARAVRTGAKVSAEKLDNLISSLLRRAEQLPEPYTLALAVARLRVPKAQQDQAKSLFQKLDPFDFAVLQALTVDYWTPPPGDPDTLLRRVLSLSDRPRRRTWGSDPAFGEAVLVAARHLLPGDDATALAIYQASGRTSVGAAERIRSEMGRRGHMKLVIEQERKEYGSLFDESRWKAAHEASSRGWTAFMEAIADADPAPLTKVESRRLDDLADFLASVQFTEMPYHWSFELDREPDGYRLLVDVAAHLGGFSRGLLSAESRIAISLQADENDHSMLYYGATARELTRWRDVPPSIGWPESLVGLIQGGRFLAFASLLCLEAHPDRQRVVDMVAPLIDSLVGEDKELVAKALLDLDPDPVDRVRAWLSSSDLVLAAIAASWIGIAANASGDFGPDLVACLSAQSLLVRSAALRELGEPGEAPLELLEIVAAFPAQEDLWACPRCGAENDVGQRSCHSCSVVNNYWASWSRVASERLVDT